MFDAPIDVLPDLEGGQLLATLARLLDLGARVAGVEADKKLLGYG